MRTKLLLSLALVGWMSFVAQAQFNKRNLVGTWQLDATHLLKNMPEEQKARNNDINKELMSMMFLSGTMEFKSDGTAITVGPSFSGKGKKSKGTWKLDGKELVVNENSNLCFAHLIFRKKHFNFFG